MKKRFPCLLLAALLCITSGYRASAASVVPYTLDGAGVSLEISSDLTVFTRDTDHDDPNLLKYGFTLAELLSMMRTDNAYLLAFGASGDYALIVTAEDNTSGDLRLMDDATLEELLGAMDSTYATAGLTITDSEIYSCASEKYFKVHYTSGSAGSGYTAVQYYTVSGHKSFSIALYSYTGAITSGQETVIKSAVDSVVFDGQPAGESPSAAYTYADTDGGVSFTVPAGWSEVPFEKQGDYFAAGFSPDSNPTVTVAYLRADIWGPMSDSERAGRARAEMNVSKITEREIADFLDLPAAFRTDISRTEFGGQTYFKLLSETDGSESGIDMTFDLTQFVYIENGYMYIFQFGSAGESEYYPDFEALLESVSYPAPAVSSAVSGGLTYASGTSAASGGWASRLSGLGDIALALLVTMVVFSLPVAIYRHGIRKRPVPRPAGLAITAVYGLVCLLLVYLFFGLSGVSLFISALIFWSLVNYFVLTCGRAVPGADGRGAGPTGGDSSDPDGDMSDPDDDMSDPDDDMSDPDDDTSDPDDDTSDPDDDMSDPDDDTSDPDDDMSDPGEDTSDPDDDTPEPESAPEFPLCPHCGGEVKPGSVRCPGCGEKLFTFSAGGWKNSAREEASRNPEAPEPEWAHCGPALCPHCGSAVKPGSITCLTCGEKLYSCGAAVWKQASEKKEPAEEAPPEADAEPEAGVTFLRCPSCGRRLPPGSRYCDICGAKMARTDL